MDLEKGAGTEEERKLRELDGMIKMIKSVEQNYPVKNGEPAPPCKPYETVRMIEKMEKAGLIPKPGYRLISNPADKPVYSFS